MRAEAQPPAGPRAKAIMNKAMAQANDSLSQVISERAMLAVAQPRDPSPPGSGGSLAQATINKAAVAGANDSQSQIKSGSAVLAAAQPRGHSFPGTEGSFAQAIMDKAMIQANDPHTHAKHEDIINELNKTKDQLNRLNDDIAISNEQLAILQRLRELRGAH